MKSKQLKEICAVAWDYCIAAHPKEVGKCLQTNKADPCDNVLREFLEVRRYGFVLR
jgi:hypothetical protein